MIYLDHLLRATNGFLRYQGKYTDFEAFSHDTRQLSPGEMFVAVRGERGNGHDYLLDAVRLGAKGLLVNAKTLNNLSEQTLAALAQAEVAVVVVEDTRLALQRYARAILKIWHPTVIAITGSVGKTSIKEAIATVLSSQFTTFRSWQNYNDLLGIPLSLGRLEAQHEYAVLELGCDHPGEINELCRMVCPQIGVLTNVNPVHLQYFQSIEHLALELGMLLKCLPDGGHFFYNQDDTNILTLIDNYKATQQRRTVTLHTFAAMSSTTCESGYPADAYTRQNRVTYVGWDGVRGMVEIAATAAKKIHSGSQLQISSHLLGAHHFSTMLAAYQVGLSRGMHPRALEYALTNLYPLTGRLNPLPGVRNARLLDDTHNASPAAVIAGLATLHALTPAAGQRIAVLGDMLSLGDHEQEAHRTVGRQVACYADYLVTRGERAALIAEAAHQAGLPNERIIMTSTHEDAAQAVWNILEHLQQPEIAAVAAEQQIQDVVLVKGSEETRMERVVEMLMARPWEAPEKLVRQTPGWKKIFFRHADRPTWVEIDLNAIGSNTRHIKSLVGPRVQVMVSLKADAYGHGALKVARTVLHNGASMLGVATVSEAVPLREANISAPILVYGYVPLWQMREAVRLDVTVTLYASEAAQALSLAALALNKTVKVHIKVDTGMARLGIRAEELEEIVELVKEIRALAGLELEGLYTHFAQSDVCSQAYTGMQLARFQRVLQALEEQGLRPPIVHAANSGATLSLREAHLDMVRPGIAIYGLDPSLEMRLPEGFRAALSFKTQISQVKWLPADEGISYGSTFVTKQQTCIAVLPVGYADGFRRGPQNWGSVLIHGQEAPILGRVCMDQCMVDVTHIPQTRVGDEVVLIGRQGEATLTAEQVAERLGTINYEVVSEILARVPRVD